MFINMPLISGFFNHNKNTQKTPPQRSSVNNPSLAYLEKDLFEKSQLNAVDKTADKLDKKIAFQTRTLSENNIKSIIDYTHKKTGVEKEELQKILARLVQFSSYSQFNNLNKSSIEQEIGAPASKFDIFYSIGRKPDKDKNILSLNKILDYLSYKKGQFDFYQHSPNSIFLDDIALTELENSKDNNICNKIIENIKQDVKNKKLNLVIFDGWDAVIDDKLVSQTFLGSQIGLQNALITIVKKMQNENLNIDEILNQKTIDRTKAIFGQDIDIKIFQNTKALKDTSIKGITQTLAPNRPSREEIKASILALLDETGNEPKAKEILDLYYDKMLFCTSGKSLSSELKRKYIDIRHFVKNQGKSMDDVYYVVPYNSQGKSFDLITYQFLKTNNIDIDKAISFSKVKTMENCDDKVFVVLDDFVGTGNSITDDEYDYDNFIYMLKNNGGLKANIVFAPVISSQIGIDKINEYIEGQDRSDTDTIITNNVFDIEDVYKELDEEENEILEKALIDTGFGDTKSCVSMPYMIPDNNSEAGTLLLHSAITDEAGMKSNLDGCLSKKAEDILNFLIKNN